MELISSISMIDLETFLTFLNILSNTQGHSPFWPYCFGSSMDSRSLPCAAFVVNGRGAVSGRGVYSLNFQFTGSAGRELSLSLRLNKTVKVL